MFGKGKISMGKPVTA